MSKGTKFQLRGGLRDNDGRNEMLNFPKEQTFDGKDRGGTRLPEEQNRQTPRAFRTGSMMREPRWGKGKANSAEQWATIYFQLDPP